MAKKKPELTADEKVEQATLEANVVREEKAEAQAPTVTPPGVPAVDQSGAILHAQVREPSVDERVAAVFSQPEPVETPEPTEAESWHAEAAEILELARAGNPVSPARVVTCLSRAVGLVPKA